MLPVRNYGLDPLRILLCLTVVFFHYSGGWNCGGSVAVDGFFVLSGFLVVRSAGGFTQGSIGEYCRKKGWRLLPVLLIAWTAGFAVLLVEGQQAMAWAGVTLLIAAPTLAMWKMMGNVAVWFIVCIMAFLALFPWLYRYYGKRPFLWLLAASVLFCCVPERHRDGLRQAVLSGEFPPVAVFAGDVVCVLEYGTVEESMAVVLDWSRRGVAAGFFCRHS